MKFRVWALIAAFTVQLLYGLNFTFAKDVIAGGYVTPFAFIIFRVGGATLLFWLFSSMGPKEKILRKDFLTLFFAAVFGVATNMLLFFKGLEYTSPIHAAVITTIVPIIVLILSTFYLKERLTALKITGVILACIGAIVLTVYGKSTRIADNVPLGNLLVLINAISYSIYIIIIKKLTDKYHPFTFIKWVFLFGLILVTPFGIRDFLAIDYSSFPSYIYFSIAFVVVGATFGTYTLNPLALRHLKASTVSIFIYIQPIIAGLFAIIMGSDSLSSVKLIASALIFSGVYLVTKKPKVEG
ncbi:DMT family transporter [Bizionia paragorgiae]|jgi:drug/metabolite transporter (DMT)-like permease|uniref:DMT family transporter n=2 Tax=Bizionia paragorgiae TaxID=283786 RepID=UPI00299E29AB|nr:DMT family transporter [Bizionia paragorgiae]MDX1271598.1 DMT family transporter [Bizionia paragorgiae]